MTRAQQRLIVSGAIDREKAADASTPIGWVLGRLEADDELDAEGPLEIGRGEARFLLRVDRDAAVGAPEQARVAMWNLMDEPAQLALFAELEEVAAPPAVPALPPLEPPPAPPLHPVRRLSFTALAQFDSCSYKYYAIRVAGMRELRAARAGAGGDGGLVATEIGDAVHRLLEQVDLRAPEPPDVEQVRAWYPNVSDEELERVASLVRAYCDSDLARRLASLDAAAPERGFTFEHDGVLLHGRLDVLHLGSPRALVVDYKTNVLDELAPEEVVEGEYRLQRLVYALACFRAGADEVDVVYSFLERPDAVVSTRFERAQIRELEAELSAAIARIHAGDFRPTPSEWNCSGCPVLDIVCAGPRLGGGARAAQPVASVPA
jgi:ATP-dependent exoDNAse (exonuclease V) beta subunit